MEKIVFRIVSFMVILALIIAMLEKCADSGERVANKLIDGLFNPLKSCKHETNTDDIRNADPVEFISLCINSINDCSTKIEVYSSTNINLQQEISPVNVLVNEYNQNVSKQYTQINNPKIEQTALINWVEKNNNNIKILEEKYNILNIKKGNIRNEIKSLKKEINSLKKAIQDNTYQQSEVVSLETYLEKKEEYLKQIQELETKMSSLEKELSENTKKLEELKKSIDSCIQKMKEINEKMDQLIEQGGKAEPTGTHYYVINTEDYLISNGIVSSGGLLGGLQVKDTLDKELFIPCDGNEQTILLGREDAEFDIISDMPAESYDIRINNKVKILVIKDLEKFWSKTDYLVIKTTE